MPTQSAPAAGTSVAAYVGDPTTRLVHRHPRRCPGDSGVFFLQLATALALGYHLCTCCASAAHAE
jgi:hypothetical protein